jgi:hypothetical protein
MTRRLRTADEMIKCAARMIQAAGEHVAQEDPAQLARLVKLQEVLSESIVDAVMGQRDAGITWQSMGDALGTTKQAVIQRWGPRVAA